MIISPVSSASSSASSSSSTSLTQKLADLQKQLKAETQSKDDAKTKEVKEAAIQLQIDQVTAQIAKAKEASSGNAQSTSSAPKSEEPPPTYA